MKLTAIELRKLAETEAYPGLLARLNAFLASGDPVEVPLGDLLPDVAESSVVTAGSYEDRVRLLIDTGELGAAQQLLGHVLGSRYAGDLKRKRTLYAQDIEARQRAMMGRLLVLAGVPDASFQPLRLEVERLLGDTFLIQNRPGRFLDMIAPLEAMLDTKVQAAIERVREQLKQLEASAGQSHNPDLDRAIIRIRQNLESSETLPAAYELLSLAARARAGHLSAEDIQVLHRPEPSSARLIFSREEISTGIQSAGDAAAAISAGSRDSLLSTLAHDQQLAATLRALTPVGGRIPDRVAAARLLAQLLGTDVIGTPPGGLCEIRFSHPRVPALRQDARVFPQGVRLVVPHSSDDASLPTMLSTLPPHALKIIYHHRRMERSVRPIQTLDPDVIFFDIADVLRVATCEHGRRQHAFQQIVLPRLPVTRIKPYRGGGPVPPEMFRGRREVLDELRQPKGRTVLFSGRMMGKSSILTKLDAELKQRAPGSSYPETSIFISNAGDDLLTPLVDRLSTALGGTTGAKFRSDDDRMTSLSGMSGRSVQDRHRKRLANLRRLITSVLDKFQRLTILIDEADSFAKADGEREREDSLAWLLRDMETELPERLRVIFAGFQTIHREVYFRNSAFANWFGLRLLGPLPTEEARSLIMEPFADLGFVFSSEPCVTRLMDFTGRHPLLLHEACARLMDRVAHRRSTASHDEVVVVQAGDVESVCREEPLTARLRQVLSLNLEDYPRLKLMVYLILFASRADGRNLDIWAEGFKLDDLRSILVDLFAQHFSDHFDERSLAALMQELAALGLIALQGDKYVFANKAFAEMLRSDRDFDDKLQDLLDEVTNPKQEAPRRFLTLTAADLERLIVARTSSSLLVGLPGTSRSFVAQSLFFEHTSDGETLFHTSTANSTYPSLLAALKDTLAGKTSHARTIPEVLRAARVSRLVLDDADQLAKSGALDKALGELSGEGIACIAIGGAEVARRFVAVLSTVDVDVIAMRRLRPIDIKSWGQIAHNRATLILDETQCRQLAAFTGGYAPLLEAFREHCHARVGGGAATELIPDRQMLKTFEEALTPALIHQRLLSFLDEDERLLLRELYAHAGNSDDGAIPWDYALTFVIEPLGEKASGGSAVWLDRLEVLRLMDLVGDRSGSGERWLQLNPDGPVSRALSVTAKE